MPPWAAPLSGLAAVSATGLPFHRHAITALSQPRRIRAPDRNRLDE
jgi:hypothetical protein